MDGRFAVKFDGGALHFHINQRAVQLHKPRFGGGWQRLTLFNAHQARLLAFQAGGVDQVGGTFAQQVVQVWRAKQFKRCRVGVHDLGVSVHQNRIWRPLDQGAVALLAGFERDLGAFVVGDVLHNAQGTVRLAVQIKLQLGTLTHPVHRAVDDDAVLAIKKPARECGLPGCLDPGAVFLMHQCQVLAIVQVRAHWQAQNPAACGGWGDLIGRNVADPAAHEGHTLGALQQAGVLLQQVGVFVEFGAQSVQGSCLLAVGAGEKSHQRGHGVSQPPAGWLATLGLMDWLVHDGTRCAIRKRFTSLLNLLKPWRCRAAVLSGAKIDPRQILRRKWVGWCGVRADPHAPAATTPAAPGATACCR